MRTGGWHDGIKGMQVLEGKRLGVSASAAWAAASPATPRRSAWTSSPGARTSPTRRPPPAAPGGSSKDELLATSDFVTIHLVLSDRTRGLSAPPISRKMKKSAMLINTSRGPIVEEASADRRAEGPARSPACRARRVRQGAAADGPSATKLDNVTLVPHLGYVVEETYRDF